MDELEQKRTKKYLEKNKDLTYNLLFSIAHKDEIIANQEKFKIDSLKNITRMKQLINEIYDHKILLLREHPNDQKMHHLSVYVVNDKRNLFEVLNHHLIDILGNEYEVTHELLIIPHCLSFNNGENKLYLCQYDWGVVEV